MHYLTYIAVWCGVLALLILNIALSRALTGWAGSAMVIGIASLQAFLVLSIFMRLRFEKGLIRLIVPLAILIMLILAGLVFSDVVYRG